ncbi:autotransporter domain-containing protein [Niveibacterium sp.]|uniref:autotransporter domain-containing protein n=1 Tax=Niveibacterium sp. TaxID=2017444 RepID=UPI0035B2C4B1
MFIRHPLGAAIAALFAIPAAANDFNATVFFGDSLTDSGYYAGQAGVTGGKFTTNPGKVWAENLAAKLGTSATPALPGTSGTDYAQGGARISGSPAIGVPDAWGAETITAQINRHLASNGGVADSRTLYTLWGGANDIFYAVGTFGSDTGAITNYVLATTTDQVNAVKTLFNAGAKYVMVPNLPDIGATPLGISAGAAGAAGLTTLASNYNSALFGKLAGEKLNIIPLDAFHLLREVQADPARYGFSNTTDRACGATRSLMCTPSEYVASGADQSYVFADDVHPTTAAHALLADYAYSMLIAPQQIGMLAETAVRTRSAFATTLLDQAIESPTRPNRVWATANGGKLSYGEDADASSADGLPFGVSAGFDARNSLGGIGVAFNVNRYAPDFGGNTGNYSQSEVSVSLYGSMLFGQLGLAFAGTLGYLDYDTTRSVKLGAATRDVDGKTDGSNVSFAMRAHYQLQSGRLTHGPVLDITAQRVQVAGFAEDTASGVSTALTFGEQVRSSVLGRLGYQMAYDANGFIPYGRVGIEHDFIKSGDRDIKVGTPSVYVGRYALPAGEVEQNAASVQLGSRFLLSPQLGTWVEFNGTFGRKNVDDYGLSAGVRYAF